MNFYPRLYPRFGLATPVLFWLFSPRGIFSVRGITCGFQHDNLQTFQAPSQHKDRLPGNQSVALWNQSIAESLIADSLTIAWCSIAAIDELLISDSLRVTAATVAAVAKGLVSNTLVCSGCPIATISEALIPNMLRGARAPIAVVAEGLISNSLAILREGCWNAQQQSEAEK